jgi:hypothetical protein
MKEMRLFWLAGCFVLLAACADPSASQGGTASPASAQSIRVDVYEALIRHLVNPDGTQPIYVPSDLCYQLMKERVTCPDRLTGEERSELKARLQDLGEIVFLPDKDVGTPLEEPFQEILLGPIVEAADGLRVEGGSVCGSVCGNGAVYVVAATEDGYKVTGTDDMYGAWVA